MNGSEELFLETVEAVVERITYSDEESGYTVVKVKIKGYSKLAALVGNMPSLSAGCVITATGSWKIDNKYGRQFCVEKYEENLPSSIYGIEKYLGSGLIKGIGKKFAKRIVEKFKEDTIEIIEEYPERLSEIEGIGGKLVYSIKTSWLKQKEIKNLIMFLQSIGISTSIASKIYNIYDNRSIEIIKENPYKLSDDIWGIGFKTADMIAEKLGVNSDSYIRCRSGIFYTLNKLSQDGHCYAEWQQLVDAGSNLLGVEESKIVMTAGHMKNEKEIFLDEGKYYLPPIYYSEVGVARLIKNIAKSSNSNFIDKYELDNSMNYDELQIKAINLSLTSKFLIITGGAGTGKTTTIKSIIKCFSDNNAKVLLTAPTGRASKRMFEVTGIESKTIHRILDYKILSGYQKDETNPLKGDLLIVDEASMIDIVLMYNLLKAVPNNMKVILVGDVNQLPSINAGNVLDDIIQSGCVDVVNLEKIFRQSKFSNIIKNAHNINNCKMIDTRNDRDSDFFFISELDSSKITQLILDLYTHRLPKKYNLNPINDIQVLSPMKYGLVGINNLNIILQKAINNNKISISRGGTEFKVADKVMQIKNNYDKEIFNGDIGYINTISMEDNLVFVDFDNKIVEYDFSQLDELVLAYATTIHKSQGSEYPVVIMPIAKEHSLMLNKKLIYTGMTRAKKLLILIGQEEVIQKAIKNNNQQKRNSFLDIRLK